MKNVDFKFVPEITSEVRAQTSEDARPIVDAIMHNGGKILKRSYLTFTFMVHGKKALEAIEKAVEPHEAPIEQKTQDKPSSRTFPHQTFNM